MDARRGARGMDGTGLGCLPPRSGAPLPFAGPQTNTRPTRPSLLPVGLGPEPCLVGLRGLGVSGGRKLGWVWAGPVMLWSEDSSPRGRGSALWRGRAGRGDGGEEGLGEQAAQHRATEIQEGVAKTPPRSLLAPGSFPRGKQLLNQPLCPFPPGHEMGVNKRWRQYMLP